MASYKIPEIQNIKILIFCVLTLLLHIWPIVCFPLLNGSLETAEKDEICGKIITPCLLLYPIIYIW